MSDSAAPTAACAPVAAVPPFNSDTGWAEWTLTLPLQQIDSRATFDGASIHTATQFEGTLMFAHLARAAFVATDLLRGFVS